MADTALWNRLRKLEQEYERLIRRAERLEARAGKLEQMVSFIKAGK
jgi:hypothetical protein